MERKIAKRLQIFLDNHVSYYDDGDAENGPHLSGDYTGPTWAIDLAMETEMPGYGIFSQYVDQEENS